jgi:hypothetical protein
MYIIFLVPVIIGLNTAFHAPLLDRFHEGEYLGNLLNMMGYYSKSAPFPVFVHGAMDYMPALISFLISDEHYYIALTRYLNIGAVVICWIMWLDMSRVILRRHEEKLVWLGLFYLIFLWMTLSIGADPVLKQQSFIGTRDLFLMLSIWSSIRSSSVQPVSGKLFLLFSGVFAAFALYWSYDRGILSLIWILGMGFVFILNGRQREVAIIFASYICSIFALSEIGLFGKFSENIYNIKYWIINTGEVWNYPLRDKIIALPYMAGMIGLFLFAVYNIVASDGIKKAILAKPYIVGLILMQIVLFGKMLSLPGFPTSYYFIWPTLLLLIFTPPKLLLTSLINKKMIRIANKADELRANFLKSKSLLFFSACLILIFLSNALVHSALSIRNLGRLMPNEKILEKKYYGIDTLDSRKIKCVFNWSNEGVFSVLLNVPYCTKYQYAVYISKGNEFAVLEELKSQPPDLIIYDSQFWSMSIFGRHMRNRLPNIDRFIMENYNLVSGANGYVFAIPK